MPRYFEVGALALAAPRANAVGAVRLTLAPAALEIELLRVVGFSRGFVSGGVAEPVRFTVPYVAVRGLVRRGRMLYLALDPGLVAPYNRFALARFTEDPAEALTRAYLARATARWVSYLVPLPLGALVGLLAPSSLVSGSLGRASLGVLVALAVFAVLREIVAWQSWGGPLSDRSRDALELAMAERLGLLPEVPAALDETPFPLGAARSLTRVRVAGDAPAPALPSRSILAVAFAAVFAVGVMAISKRVGAPAASSPAVETLHAGLAEAARRTHDSVAPAASGGADEPELTVARAASRPRCICDRATSPLWKEGIPALQILAFASDDDLGSGVVAREERPGSPRFELDVAAVNDGARPLRDVRVTLTFARRNKAGRRVGAVDRGLFWEGVLAPGHAVKWHVRAPGTEMRIDASVTGTLDDAGLEPAPAAAFADLTRSRYRAVRAHAALMLAYLHDPRGREAALALDGRTPEDRLLLARIARAASPVIACDAKIEGDRLGICVFNGASQPRSQLELRALPAGSPRFPIEGAIAVHEGARLDVPFDGALPEEWSVTTPGDP
ncbi:MAG: hypothetical protein ACMG6S_00215 [Byssovorax sp.]